MDHHRKVAKDSAQRLWRSPVASMMTWMVMGVALALPVALLLLLGSLQGVSAGWENSARITAYLSLDVPVEQARELASEIDGDGRVLSVELVDRDQALAEFRVSSGLDDALDFLDDNPLPHTLLVTPEDNARSADGVQALVTFMEGMDAVERVQVDLGWLQRLNAITDILARAVWALALLLGAAVILVIGNTVRLSIENRRDEILVAKLVGGTDAFVRRPFLYTGAWFGLGGGVVAWVLIQVSLWWLNGPIERLASLYQSEFVIHGPGFDGALALIITAMVLGWLGAWVAVKRHLDDIEPGDIAGG
nr:permease-like cell division protein FtsX [Marinobacter sp. G11]